MEGTEYALRKVVRNNAIVREVDEARQREMWQWGLIAVLLVLVLLVSVWQHVSYMNVGYRVAPLRRTLAADQERGRQLRLEIETLRAPKRIENLAIERLQMVAPGQDQAIVIDRVAPARRPDHAVVAAR